MAPPAPSTPTTAKRSRANTRARLLEGAREVFAEQGFGGASVADICNRAGFTRGAFYSNFASTEELFLGLWDSQATAIVARVGHAVEAVRGADDPVAAASEVLGQLPIYDRDWFLLNTEFLLHALRDPEAADLLATHRRELRAQLWPAISLVLDAGGLALPPGLDADTFTRLVIATFEGSQNQSLVEPEALGDGSLQGAVVHLLLAACPPPGT